MIAQYAVAGATVGLVVGTDHAAEAGVRRTSRSTTTWRAGRCRRRSRRRWWPATEPRTTSAGSPSPPPEVLEEAPPNTRVRA
ncbi:hypothetical protein ACIBTW_29940 [Micromonospora parva]|uniref:hypothetical protein n=1 Tax=Micromonospora parva TaxID=1464048 RepID=UPI0037B04260